VSTSSQSLLGQQGMSQLISEFPASPNMAVQGDLRRPVYGILGVPFDALDVQTLLDNIVAAASAGQPFLISTPNVNFLMASRTNREFRESLLQSDLCLVDGMPIIWIARLLGLPIGGRLAGSDLFDTLKSRAATGRRLKVFLFGGGEGVAEGVAKSLNLAADGMECVGTLNPGFGSVEELSREDIIDAINSSQADLLAVFLSADKAQRWLLHNHDRLQVPVRAQFGAVINFQAGTVKRAPAIVRRMGFEWLWRIKEEPYLRGRYWADGKGLLRLLLASAVPLGASRLRAHLAALRKLDDLHIDRVDDDELVILQLSGYATARHADGAISSFRDALAANRPISLDLSRTHMIDQRFFGLLLMLRKQLLRQGCTLKFTGMTPHMSKAFRLNGFDFLLQTTT
jgi:N-acetylglucosaminyldiphosphoundecaprenol N-acetyl-beta-D-mannosaminyltransferase